MQDYIDVPGIDRLAREGIVLNHAFCTNSICTPSRASILTGQYSHHNGVYALNQGLSPGQRTLATQLQAAGYETALFGKWHLHLKPEGFDTFQVLPGQGRFWDPTFKSEDNWEDGFQGGRVLKKGFSADVITDLSLEWLEGRSGDRPFLLLCHFKATHEPFDYPDRHGELYADLKMPEPDSLYQWEPEESGRAFIGQSIDILTQRYLNDTNGRYPGKLTLEPDMPRHEIRSETYQKFVKDFLRSGQAIDDNIVRLLDYLDEAGLAENTIVIYTADQGYFLGEHGFMDKRIMYEEPLRMPFVIRYPKSIPAGGRLDDMILNIDFTPTLLDFVGVDPLPEVDGKSFRKNLMGETPADWRDAVYYRYWQHLKVRPAHYGIRTKTEKLIHFYGQPLGVPGSQEIPTEPAWEYYNLEVDPQERQNLYSNREYKGHIEALKAELYSLKAAVGDDR